MKRPDDPTGPANRPDDFADADWVKRYPTICEFLVSEEYDDKSPRTPSGLGLKAQDGLVMVCINDHDLRRSLYISGESVGAALKNLDAALRMANADWRKWGGGKKGKK